MTMPKTATPSAADTSRRCELFRRSSSKSAAIATPTPIATLRYKSHAFAYLASSLRLALDRRPFRLSFFTARLLSGAARGIARPIGAPALRSARDRLGHGAHHLCVHRLPLQTSTAPSAWGLPRQHPRR